MHCRAGAACADEASLSCAGSSPLVLLSFPQYLAQHFHAFTILSNYIKTLIDNILVNVSRFFFSSEYFPFSFKVDDSQVAEERP